MNRILVFVTTVCVLIGGTWIWALRYPVIAAIPVQSPESFAPEEVDEGETLVAFGGCVSCHTSPGGAAFAGGRPLLTPFGTIHSTNITPDPDTGIGRWSEEAFRRAIRQGIDREGGYLYPAFPYDHYSKVTDRDIRAIYAFLMTRSPVRMQAPQNGLAFPFNIRLLMAGWNLLFHDPTPFEPDTARNAAWNRGAYLVEGLGHCAACHSPRNPFGARDRSRDYDGGIVEGWYSPALNASSPAPIAWNEDSLINYLYDGWDEAHGIAAGPMKDVIDHTSVLPENDVIAVATYLLSLQETRAEATAQEETALAFANRVAFNGPGPVEAASNEAAARGLAIFERHCGNCHKSGSESVPLALATAVAGPDPRNFIRVVVSGAKPNENAFFVRPMPAFSQLSARDLADLAMLVRERFSRLDPWTDIDAAVEEIYSGAN